MWVGEVCERESGQAYFTVKHAETGKRSQRSFDGKNPKERAEVERKKFEANLIGGDGHTLELPPFDGTSSWYNQTVGRAVELCARANTRDNRDLLRAIASAAKSSSAHIDAAENDERLTALEKKAELDDMKDANELGTQGSDFSSGEPPRPGQEVGRRSDSVSRSDSEPN